MRSGRQFNLVERSGARSFDQSGSDLGRVFNAGRLRIKKIDKSKLGQRDAGWYGAGFYVAERASYVRKWYGPVVTEFEVASTARVLRASISADLAPAGLFDAVLNHERGLLKQRGQLKELANMRALLKKNQIEWVHAVDRFAEAKHYDIVWFCPEEIVVKKPSVLKIITGQKTRLESILADVQWLRVLAE